MEEFDVIHIMKYTILTAVAAAALIGCSHSSQHTTGGHHTGAAKPYKLQKCLVSDEAFDHDTYTFVHNGQEVKLCCKSCLGDFKKDPNRYLSKLR